MKSEILDILEREKENLPEDVYFQIKAFFNSTAALIEQKTDDVQPNKDVIALYLSQIVAESKNPTQFGTFHEAEKGPIDFAAMAHDVFAPFVNQKRSRIEGKENIEQIISYLEKGENVMMLANHQAEGDPTFLDIVLNKDYPGLIRNMIAVAGARVTTDPIVIPFTRGMNTICVYSKKYFELHADRKKEMLRHNSASMIALRHQLDIGGKLVYVAPSGGRDRYDDDDKLLPAQFNPDSIELMRIVGAKSKQKTHYFPLGIYSFPILPPPKKIKKEIGEERKMCHSPVHVHFGSEYIMKAPNADEKKDKTAFREKQAGSIHSIVLKLYELIAET